MFAIELPINDAFGMFFALFWPLVPTVSPVEQVAIWGSYVRDEARAPDLPFAKNIFRLHATANCSKRRR